MIRSSGPISVATYMDVCLHDRRHGYYATRPGLGQDFITAPEISQIFGELIGLWTADAWQEIGAPAQFTWVEIGPGRGTLMTDALRATRHVDGFHDALRLHFIEASPVLRATLSEQFSEQQPSFLYGMDQIPAGAPIFVVANEWLDCLPVQQYLRVGNVWHERVVGVNDEGELTFGLNPDALPDSVIDHPELDAIEIQPGLQTLAAELASLFATAAGRALFIDYGPPDRPPVDTLRSYRDGAQIHPLQAPGASDLTCDVDFARLKRLIEHHDLSVTGPKSQSEWLLSLGAEVRLNQLARENPTRADTLYADIRKLVDPAETGTRFQVVEIGPRELPQSV